MLNNESIIEAKKKIIMQKYNILLQISLGLELPGSVLEQITCKNFNH